MTTSTMVRDAYQRMIRAVGVDRAVAFTVLGQGWLSIAGLIGLAVVGRYLSPDEQGYYYTFYSLLALQSFAELGLSNVILQFASHEAAHLELSPKCIVDGPLVARSRLASILRFSLKWYGAAAITFVVLLLPAGSYFFATFSGEQSGVMWLRPWTFTVLATAGFLLLTPIPALLQGCGMVAEVAQMRLIQALGAHTAVWIAIFSGAGLASAAVFAAANLAIAVVWLTTKYRLLIFDLLSVDLCEIIDWRSEIWPYQWRIAISWLCGYFIFQIFTPLVFAFHGPVEAGRMGMSLTIAAAVSTIGMSWLSTRMPRMGALVSLRRFDELDTLFFRSMKQAICVSVVVACLVVAACMLIHASHHQFANRILPTWPLVFLMLANVVNLIVTAEATYLRAFKQEPFLIVSIFNATFTTLTALILANTAGPSQIAFGYLLVDASVGLGFGTWVFRTKRNRWQSQTRKCGSRQLTDLRPAPRLAA